MVNYVMELAPYAVFAAMTTVVANKGLSILISYGYLMICFLGDCSSLQWSFYG